MLVVSGGMLVTLWVPIIIRQHAPTLANSKGFRDWAQQRARNFSSARDMDTTQNSMNSQVLAHVGGSHWVTNMVPMCIHISANVMKQHEFPVFGDDRRVTLRESFRCVVRT